MNLRFKNIFFPLQIVSIENSTYGVYTFNRIPVGRYGSSCRVCDKNTAMLCAFPKASPLSDIRLLCRILTLSSLKPGFKIPERGIREDFVEGIGSLS